MVANVYFDEEVYTLLFVGISRCHGPRIFDRFFSLFAWENNEIITKITLFVIFYSKVLNSRKSDAIRMRGGHVVLNCSPYVRFPRVYILPG